MWEAGYNRLAAGLSIRPGKGRRIGEAEGRAAARWRRRRTPLTATVPPRRCPICAPCSPSLSNKGFSKPRHSSAGSRMTSFHFRCYTAWCLQTLWAMRCLTWVRGATCQAQPLSSEGAGADAAAASPSSPRLDAVCISACRAVWLAGGHKRQGAGPAGRARATSGCALRCLGRPHRHRCSNHAAPITTNCFKACPCSVSPSHRHNTSHICSGSCTHPCAHRSRDQPRLAGPEGGGGARGPGRVGVRAPARPAQPRAAAGQALPVRSLLGWGDSAHLICLLVGMVCGMAFPQLTLFWAAAPHLSAYRAASSLHPRRMQACTTAPWQ